jgi:hypothetical protein
MGLVWHGASDHTSLATWKTPDQFPDPGGNDEIGIGLVPDGGQPIAFPVFHDAQSIRHKVGSV